MPTDNSDVVNVATPPLRVPVPMELPPSLNVTVPVGVPDPGATAETVTVKVIDCPKTAGFTEEVCVDDVSALLTVNDAVLLLVEWMVSAG